YKNYVNLGTGLGLSWYHYNFRNSYSLTPNVPYATATFDSLKYSKNRLVMTYVNVPLFLEFNTNNKDAKNSFHFGGGLEFGYNVFNNRLKQKYELDGHTYKRKEKDDFNVNPFRYDVIARIGYGDFTIFAAYSLSTLFEKEKGPTVYPFSAGINIHF
ncbi:MAG TPA: outer membrane beta-barrel protein, partial [Bacteroidia bacterium]|nr:outer membrane beta-barrel protein [Bacteroidia bacterium]